MTPLDPDHREPADELDPLDELASAHLDGLTSPEDEARIAVDPDLLARVAAMEAVRDALREPVPVDEAARERAIAAALAVYDADHGPAPASHLGAAAARRHAQRRTLRVLGIAAAVLLLVIAVPLLAELAGDGSDDDLAATSGEAADQPSAGEESATLDASSGAMSTTHATGEADAAQREYSGEPSPGSSTGSRRLGLLDEVEGIGQRVAALVLDALRLLGRPQDP